MVDQEQRQPGPGPGPMNLDQTWLVLLALAQRAKSGTAVTAERAVHLVNGSLKSHHGLGLRVDPSAPRHWSWPAGLAPLPAEVVDMLDLYMPLCVGQGANTLVVAHLGQSLDGRIATHTGASQFITGEENLVHAHRMRALFDAVLVGAHTAATDNPRLTTRLANGDHATRVLLDPRCSVDTSASIFTDGASRTVVLCDEAHRPTSSQHTYIGLPCQGGVLDCQAMLEALRAEGLGRIFIEGGGVTVSAFLRQRCLDRLHVCVAPMIIGSGRPAFQLPQIDDLGDGIYLNCKHFKSGRDVLFDCQVREKA